MSNETFNIPDPEIRKLYPHLTDEQLLEAGENLERYVEYVWRVYQRVINDPEAYAKLKTLLTEKKKEEQKEE